MIAAGLDVGSRTVVLVTVEGGEVRHRAIAPTGINPLRRSRDLLCAIRYDRLVVTGYGRRLVGPEVGGEIVSEISAYAAGARHLYPDCRTVIDVGGQDSKAILLSESGQVEKFEMNDRCAAGTGKFLEIMATTLEVSMDELSELAQSATKTVQINSLCTVFAESEVVSLIARGEEASAIALALHEAIATRVAAMVRRVGPRSPVLFAGGGALNRCLHRLLSEKLGVALAVPQNPQATGALGAALIAGRATDATDSVSTARRRQAPLSTLHARCADISSTASGGGAV